jgi:hypothetical protein
MREATVTAQRLQKLARFRRVRDRIDRDHAQPSMWTHWRRAHICRRAIWADSSSWHTVNRLIPT